MLESIVVTLHVVETLKYSHIQQKTSIFVAQKVLGCYVLLDNLMLDKFLLCSVNAT